MSVSDEASQIGRLRYGAQNIDHSARGLTQIEAAKLLGLTQPKISAMLRGRFRGFSERKLIDCLTSLGSDVQIVIKEPTRRRANGKLTVVVA